MSRVTFERSADDDFHAVFTDTEVSALIAANIHKFPHGLRIRGKPVLPLTDGEAVAVTGEISLSCELDKGVYRVIVLGPDMTRVMGFINAVIGSDRSTNELHYFDTVPSGLEQPPFPGQTDLEIRALEVARASPSLVFDQSQFVTLKRYENVFGETASRIFESVKFFQNNREWYEKNGVPYQLGMMFSGVAGAGKSSCIKAIAHGTDRHVVSVSFNNLKTVEQLKNLFFKEELMLKDRAPVNVPIHRRLYVLEEIDTGSALLRRRLGDEEPCTVPGQLTLGDFLTVLDGARETPGRMLVMTSNHPEILDPALLRPGRVDLRATFDYADEGLVQEMHSSFFGTPLKMSGPLKSHSPAAVSQMMMSKVHDSSFDLATALQQSP